MIRIFILLIGCAASLVVGLGDYSYQPPIYQPQYYPTQNYARQCNPAIPAIIPSYAPQPPDKVTGTWYIYRENEHSYPVANSMLNYTGIGMTVDPSTGIPAEADSLVYSYYNSSADQQCIYQYRTGLIHANGLLTGQLYEPDSTTQIAGFNLYVNPDFLHVIYTCAKSIFGNPTCVTPQFYVLTRKSPLQLTDQDLQNIDRIVDGLLAPFCLSAAQLMKPIHVPGKPYCSPPQAVPPCFLNAIRGYQAITSQQIY